MGFADRLGFWLAIRGWIRSRSKGRNVAETFLVTCVDASILCVEVD